LTRSLALLIVLSSIVATTLIVAGSPGSRAGSAQGPLSVVISEVAWFGTACSAYDEWIELYSNDASPIDLAGWRLRAADGSPDIPLQGTIPAHGFFLLERQDDNTISDVLADLIYSGALHNDGETLQLLNASAVVVDTANGGGGAWPGGSSDLDRSMERLDPSMPDSQANWGTNDGIRRNGLDCNFQPINGTPKAANSIWVLPGADLRLDKRGPERVLPGARITYTIALSNAGSEPAHTVRLTDALPAQIAFLTHTAPYTFHQPTSGTLVWELGAVPTTTSGSPITFTLTAQVAPAASGVLANVITATSTSHPEGSSDTALTIVGAGPGPSPVLIDALYYNGYAYGDDDEAFRLLNVSTQAVDIGGWRVTDRVDGTGGVLFPPGTTLDPKQGIWCTRSAAAFEEQFGFKADFAASGADPEVGDLDGSWPLLLNSGEQCLLHDALGTPVDALVYAAGDTAAPGWQGPAVEPWSPNSYFGAEGQILYRKRDQITGLPLADTGTAADWAQDPADQVYGRKARYPGWDFDQFFWTNRVTETAVLTVAVGPDHLLETLLAQIEGAQRSIWIEGYTLESAALTHALTERLEAGVAITVLLEGGPAGGIDPAQRWACGQIHAAGGQIYFMSAGTTPTRYRFQHAKVILVDERRVLIGSENLNPTSMPVDDKQDGTAGRRGVYLITNAPGVVSHVQALLQADIDPAHHGDLVTCQEAPVLCIGSPPFTEPNWTSYTVAFSEPLTLQGTFAFEIVQSPENSLRTVDGLLGLLARAGEGDTILVEQLYEHLYWGSADGAPLGGDPETDPNLRLEAYVDAARRGATVRILLNGFTFADYHNENVDTVEHLRSVATREGLDLQARLGNPTHLGLHNKMVLARIDGQGTVHVGSINGSEVSAKVNRELALQVQSGEAFDYLRQVFDHDWRLSPLVAYLPLVTRNHATPPRAETLLLGELYYAVSKEDEWVEIVNPTFSTVNLSAYRLGDAEQPDVYEGMYHFPPGAVLGPGQVLVVAASASAFQQNYGRPADYEFYATDSGVPNLIPVASWGTGGWELRNDGDEVLLMDGQNRLLDLVVYGDDSYPGHISHPGVSLTAHSLERYPYYLDTDDCSVDWRDWPFPNPGQLPGPGSR